MEIKITKDQLARLKAACEDYGLDPMETKAEIKAFIAERIDEFCAESENASH